MLHIHNNRSITLPKILKRPIKLYNARIRWRGESLLKSMSNTMRDLIIYHKMQYIHYKRGEQCAQNKLILLLLTKKERVDMWRRTNKIINFRYIRRKKQNGAINKVEGTLTKKIWLHLHSSIQIIVVRKLQQNNLLSSGQSNYGWSWGPIIWRGTIETWEQEPLFYSARKGVCCCGKEPVAIGCVWSVDGATTSIRWREKLKAVESIRERWVLIC